jgi:hypothetical protein
MKAYPIKLFSIQTNPNIHPTVVSPLKLLQLKTISILKCFPATSAENNISTVATAYHITCNSSICVRIFRGGSSVRAPGRGGRRLRTMLQMKGEEMGECYRGSICNSVVKLAEMDVQSRKCCLSQGAQGQNCDWIGLAVAFLPSRAVKLQ